MAQYDALARFYDAVTGEPVELVALLHDALARHAPSARRVLELGCGTGAVLAGLGSDLLLTGVDLSEAMLTRAALRLPNARLLRGDITTLDMGETFDVVVCVCDTLNHVTSDDGWRAVIDVAHSHLEPGGLFIVDVNTRRRLRDLADLGEWVDDVDELTLITSVEFSSEPLATWDIRIFERLDNTTYRLHHEVIAERAIETDELVASLTQSFEVLEVVDSEGFDTSTIAPRAVVIARRRDESDDIRTS